MQKKVLVVDNDFFFVEFLSELLTKRGYKVLKAYDGKEGIAMLEQESINILFADLVLPKIDGRQLFHLIRNKHSGDHFPMVALSGIIIEQLGSLDEIGADYFIAKGPIDKLAIKLNEFMAELETQPFFPPTEKKVLSIENVFPRRDAAELLKLLLFHQAVIECASVGILIVDNDTRIINANQKVLDIIDKSLIDVINCPVADLFANGTQAENVDKLKDLILQPKLTKWSFHTTFNSQVVDTLVSPIELKEDIAGWVVVLQSSPQGHAI